MVPIPKMGEVEYIKAKVFSTFLRVHDSFYHCWMSYALLKPRKRNEIDEKRSEPGQKEYQ